jgi:hypothetical protein
MIRGAFSSVTTVVLLAASFPATAALIPPPGFDPDDGATLFFHEDSAIHVEVMEFPPLIGFSTFGFFFDSAPGSLIPIFGPEDQSGPGADPPPQMAVIDFNQSKVFDVDASELQSDFSGVGPGNIGFFLMFSSTLLYSLPSLNPGGFDPVATFPRSDDPSVYMIAFENQFAAGIPLVLELGVGLRPVPEPSTALFLSLGMALVLARIRPER